MDLDELIPRKSFHSNLERIQAVLIDLSGTIHVGDTAVEGAQKSIANLLTTISSANVKFVSNTSKQCLSWLYARLIRLGFDIEQDQLFTSLTAAKEYILQHSITPLLLLHPDAMPDFSVNPNCVLIGLAPNEFHYDRLNQALRLLMDNPQTQLIAVNKSRYFQTDDGLSLGAGTFVTGLEFSTNKQAIVIGKPSVEFFHSAIKSISPSLSPSSVIMIGDDWRDDILGAAQAGIKGILVKTGKYRDGDEQKLRTEAEKLKLNDFIFVAESIAEAVQLIKRRNEHFDQ